MAVIKESEMLGNGTAFLDTLESLRLNESHYAPQLVNIVHNTRLGQDLVQLESFIHYSKENGFTDVGEAMYRVCEANGVSELSSKNIGFMVREENILADDALLETVQGLIEAGNNVYIIPIPSVSPYVKKLNEALEADDEETKIDDCVNINQYINEEFMNHSKNTKSVVLETAKKIAAVNKVIKKEKANLSKAVGTDKVTAAQRVEKLKKVNDKLKKKMATYKKPSRKATMKGAKSNVC